MSSLPEKSSTVQYQLRKFSINKTLCSFLRQWCYKSLSLLVSSKKSGIFLSILPVVKFTFKLKETEADVNSVVTRGGNGCLLQF